MSLARTYPLALKSRFERASKPGAHSSSTNRLDFEDLTDADAMALKMYKEKEDLAAERRGVGEGKNDHKKAVAAASDFLAPPPPPATSYMAKGGADTGMICIDSEDSGGDGRKTKMNQKKGGGKKGRPLAAGATGGFQDAIKILGTQQSSQQDSLSKIVDLMIENRRSKAEPTAPTAGIAAELKQKYETLSVLKKAFDDGVFTKEEYDAEKRFVLDQFSNNKENNRNA